jgi:hypothetical protein
MEELGDQCKVVFAYLVTGNTMEELGDQCKVVFAYFVTGNTMEELGDQRKVVFAYFVTGNTMEELHCNKTLRGIPPPWLDGAGVNSEGKGKWFPCQARVYTPPNTELFWRLRNFLEIYCVKKRQSGRSVGSKSHPMDNWSWPIPLDHSNLVLRNIKHNILATPLTFPAWRNVK